jgi:hypothetical protein
VRRQRSATLAAASESTCWQRRRNSFRT